MTLLAGEDSASAVSAAELVDAVVVSHTVEILSVEDNGGGAVVNNGVSVVAGGRVVAGGKTSEEGLVVGGKKTGEELVEGGAEIAATDSVNSSSSLSLSSSTSNSLSSSLLHTGRFLYERLRRTLMVSWSQISKHRSTIDLGRSFFSFCFPIHTSLVWTREPPSPFNESCWPQESSHVGFQRRNSAHE